MSEWLGALELTGFVSPALGLALALAALVAWVRAARTPPPRIAWPATAELRAAGARRRDWSRPLGLSLRAAALLALAAALAGPLGPASALRSRERGLDLLLVLDTSESMRALDAEGADGARTRLELAREAVARFALHRVASGDRVGLVVFGDEAVTHCPLSSDGRLLRAALDRVEAGMVGGSTALGDGLALAVKRLHAIVGDSPTSNRVVVLLTDGRSNAGSVPPAIAAALAAELGVRVHTVGIGGTGEVPMAAGTGGRSLGTVRQDLDAETLQLIAATSGGRYFAAQRSSDLAAVYALIDRLERVERDADEEPPGLPAPEPMLAVAGLALALEVLLARVLGRRAP